MAILRNFGESIGGMLVSGTENVGTLGSVILADTAVGDHGPGAMYNDGLNPAKYYRMIVSPLATFPGTVKEDGSFEANISFSRTYSLYEDNLLVSSGAPFIALIGGTHVTSNFSQTFNLLSAVAKVTPGSFQLYSPVFTLLNGAFNLNTAAIANFPGAFLIDAASPLGMYADFAGAFTVNTAVAKIVNGSYEIFAAQQFDINYSYNLGTIFARSPSRTLRVSRLSVSTGTGLSEGFDMTEPMRPTAYHDPQAALDYSWDWRPFLEDMQDEIEIHTFVPASGASVVQTNSGAVGVITGIVQVTASVGSTVGVTSRIVTTNGRTNDRTIYLKVSDR